MTLGAEIARAEDDLALARQRAAQAIARAEAEQARRDALAAEVASLENQARRLSEKIEAEETRSPPLDAEPTPPDAAPAETE